MAGGPSHLNLSYWASCDLPVSIETDEDPRWSTPNFEEDLACQDGLLVNMENSVNDFMNQNGVKPGFLEENKDTHLPNFEISMESTDNETNEATQICQVKNMEAVDSKEVCSKYGIDLEKTENEDLANKVKKRE